MLGAALNWLRAKPPIPVPPAADEPRSVRRARSVLGMGRYALGRGGRKPDAPTPFDAEGRADCSGFVSWCLGLDRHQPDRIGGGWISTDGMIRDAAGPSRLFSLVPVGAEVRPGDALAYGGRFVAGKRVSVGHVGLVSSVPVGWRYEGPASLKALRIIHCAASGRIAVRESDGAAWRKRGVVVRLNR